MLACALGYPVSRLRRLQPWSDGTVPSALRPDEAAERAGGCVVVSPEGAAPRLRRCEPWSDGTAPSALTAL